MNKTPHASDNRLFAAVGADFVFCKEAACKFSAGLSSPVHRRFPKSVHVGVIRRAVALRSERGVTTWMRYDAHAVLGINSIPPFKIRNLSFSSN